MKNSCLIKPEQIRNKDGVLEDPILYEDLMKITDGNRDLSLNIYRMVNQEFIDKYGGKLKYDSQGKPTISSLLKIPAVKYIFDSQVNNALQNLNKQYKAGRYSYEEAITKVGAFNRNKNFSSEYLATVTEITEGKDRGKMEFSIVKNTPTERRALENIIKQRSFRDQLIYVLANTGVKVDFVDKLLNQEPGVQGVYSTRTPEKVFDSLYTLIKVLNTDEITEQEKDQILREETGHLIVGIAENSPKAKLLFERFINLLKRSSPKDIRNVLISSGFYAPERAEQLVDETLFNIESNDDAIREAAGRIIACQLDKVGNRLKPKKDYNTGKKIIAATAGVAGLGAAVATGGMTGVAIAFTAGMTTITAMSQKIRNVLKSLFQYTNAKLHRNKDFNLEDAIKKEDIVSASKELAMRFMNQDLGDVADALKTTEEQHHQSLLEARTANKIVSSFKAFIRSLKNSGLRPKETRALRSEISKAIQNKNLFSNTARRIQEKIDAGELPEGSADVYVSRGYYNMISSMLDSIKDIVAEMEGTQLEELRAGNFEQRLDDGEIAFIPDLNEKIKCVSQLLSLIRLCSETESVLDSMSSRETSADFMANYHIDELRQSIRDMINPIMKGVGAINRQIFEASLATINGGHHYIQTCRRLVWTDKTGSYITDEVAPGWGSNKATIQNFLDEAITGDATAWGLWCQRMGASIDVINQLVSNLYDFNKAEANKEMYRYSQILLDFHERVKQELGDEDTTFICEMDKDGKITGNIVQPNYDYGTWEREYEQFVKDKKKEIKELHALEFENLDLYQQGELLYDYLAPEIEAWHKEHSQVKPDDYIDELFGDASFEEEGPRLEYLPGKEYASDQWDKLSEKQKQFVREYVGIKQSLDQFISEYHPDSITSYRLPQFRGTTISRMRHKSTYTPEGVRSAGQKMHDKLMSNSIYRTLHDEFIETFFEDALDEDFGDNSCYNKEDDSFFDGASLLDREFLRRVPVYGVNKLQDIYNLSTDVVFSTMQYAAMALNVRGMSTTAAILNNGEEILKTRVVNGSVEGTKKGSQSNIYKRYTKFLEMQVFNIRSNKLAIYKTKSGRTLLANKIMSWMSKEGSWWLLAGKIASGTVNTGTGILQICSEAAVGDHFTRAELLEGLADYFKYAAEANFTEGLAPLNRSNKYYSFIRYYDSLNNNDSYFRDFTSHMQLSRFSQLRKVNYAMWVYESGNHLMQTLPYRLKAKHTKLYKLNEGVELTEENLLDSSNFTEAGNIWDNFDEAQLQRGENVQKLKKQREKESGEPYINEGPTIIREEETGMWGNPYQEDYYVKNPDGSFVRYDRTAQSRFQTQCRYMTDNMHGIYNNPDALALGQSVLGASILTMKKYLFGYVDKLFLTDRYSVADGRNTEGAAVTWIKMLDYYNRNGDWKMKSRIYAMGAPVIASFALQLSGNSQLLSAITALSYNLVVSRGLIKGIKNQMEADGIAKYQRDNIKRFDTYMRLALMLKTISNLLSNSLWGHEQDDDDDEVKLDWGEQMDADILKFFGYNRYEEALTKQLTKSNGELKKSPKSPGVLYTIVEDAIDNASSSNEEARLRKLRYNMGVAYYFLHRWSLESETLFPFDLNKTSLSEAKTQLAQYSNLFPVGPSFMWGAADAMLACFDADKPVTYKYDKDAKTFADIFERYGDWDEDEIPDWVYAIRTGQHHIAGDNKGFNKLLQMVPYLNSIGFFEDPYKSSVSYDFGRKMTTH